MSPATHFPSFWPARPLPSFLLLGGDLVALLLFVLVGQWDHEIIDVTRPLRAALLATAPFAATWVAVAWVLRAFFLPDVAGWRLLLGRAFHAWLLAAPLGLVLRALLLGRAVIPTLFVLVTLGFGALFVLGWRLLFGLVYRGGRRHSP